MGTDGLLAADHRMVGSKRETDLPYHGWLEAFAEPELAFADLK